MTERSYAGCVRSFLFTRLDESTQCPREPVAHNNCGPQPLQKTLARFAWCRHSYRSMDHGLPPRLDTADTRCPECDERGKAMCVVLGRGVRTIHYYCLICRAQWMRMQMIPRDHIPFIRLFTND